MHDVEQAFTKLPRDVTRERVSALGWPEDRLHFAASFVGSCSGSSYEDAVKLYTPVAWRGFAQVQLHRAAAEADAGYAIDVLSRLTAAQRRDRFVRQTARRVIDACDSRGAKTADLREALTAAS